jgi:hypothetical protein
MAKRQLAQQVIPPYEEDVESARNEIQSMLMYHRFAAQAKCSAAHDEMMKHANYFERKAFQAAPYWYLGWCESRDLAPTYLPGLASQ